MNEKNYSSKQIESINIAMHTLLGKLYQNLGEYSDKLAGYNPLDLHAILLISQHPDIITKDLKEKLDVPPSTLTSIINRLEKKGLLQRVMSEKDRRSYGLELTPKGNELNDEHIRVDTELAKRFLDSMQNDEERIKLVEMLTTISKQL